MFKFHDHCIFCFEQLPTEPGGVGEHVIPKSIYGFWRLYDICDECKRYFGRNIDQLALQNVNIINAIKKLELPDADKLFDHLPYVSTDTIDQRKIPMIRKGRKFKIKSTVKDQDFLECSEDDWETFGIRWLENNVRYRVPKAEFDKEIEPLKGKYDALKPGETVHSDILNYSIRKSQTHNVEVNSEALSPITKLIAKITICFLWQVLSPQQIATIRDFEMLVKYARFGGDLRNFLINWCSLTQEVEYHKFHRLRLHVSDNTQIVDVTLFGYPNWRTVLGSAPPIILRDDKGKELEEVQLILDFEKLEKRQKYFGFKYVSENQIRYHKLDL